MAFVDQTTGSGRFYSVPPTEDSFRDPLRVSVYPTPIEAARTELQVSHHNRATEQQTDPVRLPDEKEIRLKLFGEEDPQKFLTSSSDFYWQLGSSVVGFSLLILALIVCPYLPTDDAMPDQYKYMAVVPAALRAMYRSQVPTRVGRVPQLVLLELDRNWTH